MIKQRIINNYATDENFFEQNISKLPLARDLDAFPVDLKANQRVKDVFLEGCILIICKNIV
jgi:hypothetical protein